MRPDQRSSIHSFPSTKPSAGLRASFLLYRPLLFSERRRSWIMSSKKGFVLSTSQPPPVVISDERRINENGRVRRGGSMCRKVFRCIAAACVVSCIRHYAPFRALRPTPVHCWCSHLTRTHVRPVVAFPADGLYLSSCARLLSYGRSLLRRVPGARCALRCTRPRKLSGRRDIVFMFIQQRA